VLVLVHLDVEVNAAQVEDEVSILQNVLALPCLFVLFASAQSKLMMCSRLKQPWLGSSAPRFFSVWAAPSAGRTGREGSRRHIKRSGRRGQAAGGLSLG